MQALAEQPRVVPFSKEERRQGWRGGRVMLGDEVMVTYAPGLAEDALALVRRMVGRRAADRIA